MKPLLIFLLILQNCLNAQYRDTFMEDEIVDGAAFKITAPNDPAKLYYFDIPSLINTPKPLEKMPKVKPQTMWKKTTSNDIIYDISDWYPAVKSTKNKDLWVYFNQSKGIMITNADKWLCITVREFIIDSLSEGGPLQLQVSIDYLTVDSRTDPTLESLQLSLANRSAERHFHCSTILLDFAETKMQLTAKTQIKLSARFTNQWADLTLKFEGKTIQFETYLKLHCGKTLITPLGISNGDKQSFLIIKSELVNISNQAVRLPERTAAIFGYIPEAERDPFEIPNDPEIIKSYPVPIDLLNSASGKLSHIRIKNHELFNKKDVIYDITEVITKAGIPVDKGRWAIFNQTKQIVIALNSNNNHDLLTNLFKAITRVPPPNIVTELTVFTADPRKPSDKAYDYDLLLQSNPKKILNTYSTISWLSEHQLISPHSKIRIQPSFNEKDNSYELTYAIELNEPNLKLKKDLTFSLQNHEMKLIELDLKHNGRPVIMMARVFSARGIESNPN